MPRFIFIFALLMTISIALVSFNSSAETVIHGVSIPTVEHSDGPALRICTDIGSYSVGYCFPQGFDGVRSVDITVPEDVDTALYVIGKSIFFDHNSFFLSDEAFVAINVVHMWLNTEPSARLLLSGHTDATGSEEYNDALSEERARAVAFFLSENGIDSERLDVNWFGERLLLIDTQERERRNRRVLLTITFRK